MKNGGNIEFKSPEDIFVPTTAEQDAQFFASLSFEEVTTFQKGGKTDNKKPKFEDWVKDVNPDYLSENYDLKLAFESLPFEDLERWKTAVNSANPGYFLDFKDKDGNYPFHLNSVVSTNDGNFVFLKKGTVESNPEVKYEVDAYYSGENGLKETHDLVWDAEAGRYRYIKKSDDEKEELLRKTDHPEYTAAGMEEVEEYKEGG